MTLDFQVSGVDPVDEGAHEPPADVGEHWQESWGLFWYDPHTRSGGYHHVGIQRPVQRVDEWNWIVQDGTEVAKYQSLTLPLPEHDLPNLKVPGLGVRSEKPLRRYAVRGTWDTADCELEYEGFADAYAYSFAQASMGADHYDSLGRVTGTITAGGRSVQVAGWGLQDHSWGYRRYTDLHAYRWQWAVFGEDLAFYHVSYLSDRGPGTLGYVYENGAIQPIVDGDVRVTVASDGHSPLSSYTRIRAVDGKCWELEGTVDACSASSHDEEWLFCTGLTTFRCGGRIGGGTFEMRELTHPVPVLHKRLTATEESV